MDIVICTTGEILEHKKGNRENAEYFYWSMGRVPKNFKKNDRIFFAVRNGQKAVVKGFFVCSEFNQNNDETVVWHKDSWTQIDDITIKSFRGFKYRDFEYSVDIYELNRIIEREVM